MEDFSKAAVPGMIESRNTRRWEVARQLRQEVVSVLTALGHASRFRAARLAEAVLAVRTLKPTEAEPHRRGAAGEPSGRRYLRKSHD